MTEARVVQVSISAGGVPKTAMERVRLTRLGLEGDRHRDAEHHGGPERAICLYALEAIEALLAEGHPIGPGSIGENLTVHGLDWGAVIPGRVIQVGDHVLLQVTATRHRASTSDPPSWTAISRASPSDVIRAGAGFTPRC